LRLDRRLVVDCVVHMVLSPELTKQALGDPRRTADDRRARR
jgi:hypothetical protein